MLQKLRVLVPPSVKARLRTAASALVVSDAPSFSAYRRALAGRRGSVERVRVRSLGGATIELRSGTTDGDVVWSTFFHRFHLPPKRLQLPRAPLIWDLGANIGLTMAHFASLYGNARVIGIELDPENAKFAERNTSSWSHRCELIQAAVWPTDGEIRYGASGGGGADAFAVISTESSAAVGSALALSLNSLSERGRGATVDYVKMDIEGAEKDVLREHTEWAARVRCIKVELHGDYSKSACMDDLRKLGFEAWEDPYHNICVVGLKG